MSETKTPGEKKLSVSKTDAETTRGNRRGAPELQPWPQQAGRGREGEAPLWPDRGEGRAAGCRGQKAAQPRRSQLPSLPPLHLRLQRQRNPASCCAPSPKRSAMRAPMRLPIRAYAKPKSAKSLKKKRGVAPVARRRRRPSAKRPKPASATKKRATSARKNPSARPTKSPESVLATSRGATPGPGRPSCARSRGRRSRPRARGVPAPLLARFPLVRWRRDPVQKSSAAA